MTDAMKQPLVSVIIPSYNSAATIERCVRSVLASRYPRVEVLVVDDAATDTSAAQVEALARACPGRVKLLRNERNAGPAVSRNHGAREASGRLLFFLDSDTEMPPDALDRFVARIADADAVTGIYDWRALNPGLVPQYKAMLNYYFFSRKGVIRYEVFDAARAGIRREVFESLGGFNESLGWGMDYENEEFGYRLTQHHVNLLDPSIAVRHQFPGFGKLARTYFLRVALWAEVFFSRRRFESGGVTSANTAAASAALLLAAATLPLALLGPWLWLAPAALFGAYLCGYAGFFGFVLRRRARFLPAAIGLNIVLTLIIAAGAGWGFARAAAGRSATRIGAAAAGGAAE